MSTAPTAEVQSPLADAPREPMLPLRGDTFLGVCEAVGSDLGFHPNWLRVPFAALILWNPPVIVGAYLGLGCVVAAARWFFPVERPNSAAPKLVTQGRPACAERKDEELAIAA